MTNHQDIEKLNVTIHDPSGTVKSEEWTDFSALPTDWPNYQFKAGANKKSAIWTVITGKPEPVDLAQHPSG